MTLVNMRRGKDESLRCFIEFTVVSTKITNLNSKVALHSMIMALKPRFFSINLCNKHSSNMGRKIETHVLKKGKYKKKRESQGEMYKILEEAYNIELIPLLPQSKSLEGAERSKYSKYHCNYKNTTKGLYNHDSSPICTTFMGRKSLNQDCLRKDREKKGREMCKDSLVEDPQA
ncbi:hypothetical protein CR513_31041, partial [Mucuna pruriens]